MLLAEENADDDYAEEKVSEDVPDSDFDVRGNSKQKSSVISPLETPFPPVTYFMAPLHTATTAPMQEEEDDDDDEEGGKDDVEERPR